MLLGSIWWLDLLQCIRIVELCGVVNVNVGFCDNVFRPYEMPAVSHQILTLRDVSSHVVMKIKGLYRK